MADIKPQPDPLSDEGLREIAQKSDLTHKFVMQPMPNLVDRCACGAERWLDGDEYRIVNDSSFCMVAFINTIRSVRDQARRRALLWAADEIVIPVTRSPFLGGGQGNAHRHSGWIEGIGEFRDALRRTGGKDAHEHRFDSLRIHDDDGRIFHVCLECGAREYETTDEGGKDA